MLLLLPGVVLAVDPDDVSEPCEVLPEPMELVPDELVEGDVAAVEPEPEGVEPDAVDPVSLPELIVLPDGAVEDDGLVLVDGLVLAVESLEFFVVSLAAMLLWLLWSLLRLVVVGR